MHPLADGVELRYQVGGTQPATELNCSESVVSKKALFNVEAGTNNGEKSFTALRDILTKATPPTMAREAI